MEPKSSCTPKEPFMKLGEGEAPILNYSLPQSSCFRANGRIPLEIDDSYFLDSAFEAPESHYWQELDVSQDTIEDDIANSIGNPSRTSKFFPGLKQLDTSTQATRAARPTIGTTARATTVPSGGKATAVPAPAHAEPVIDVDFTAGKIHEGHRPMLLPTFSGGTTLEFMPEPKPQPQLILMEVYKICSHLGDYGAGKTVNTFSLLPGEKTQITIRTYRDSETTKSQSENVLDSFSEESSDEFERLLQDETNNSTTDSTGSTTTNTVGGGLSLGGNIAGIEIGLSGEAGHEKTSSVSNSRTNNSSTLDKTLEKQVEQTSHTREVEVNSSSAQTEKEGEETAIVRELANINQSRVLNFVVRQLQQEYISIVALDEVKVIYTNGYPETTRVIELYELDDLLPQYVKDDHIDEVKTLILKEYCNVYNYKGKAKRFIEKVTETNADCEFADDEKITFYRKDLKLTDTAEGIKVNGVITAVRRHILRTPAVVVDSLLGQGEALDCYNTELQDAAVARAKLDNRKTQAALDIIGSIPDPAAQVRAFKNLFGVCCDDTDSTAEEES